MDLARRGAHSHFQRIPTIVKLFIVLSTHLLLHAACASTADIPHRPAGDPAPNPSPAGAPAGAGSRGGAGGVQDNPLEAWEEWGETAELKRRRPARRARGIQPGMDIHAIMGQMDKQEKIYFAQMGEMVRGQSAGEALALKYTRMLAAGGVLANLYYVHQHRQLVVRCESVRDAFVSKDFILTQPEVLKVTLDGMPHTPRPRKADDDDDDDGDDKAEL